MLLWCPHTCPSPPPPSPSGYCPAPGIPLHVPVRGCPLCWCGPALHRACRQAGTAGGTQDALPPGPTLHATGAEGFRDQGSTLRPAPTRPAADSAPYVQIISSAIGNEPPPSSVLKALKTFHKSTNLDEVSRRSGSLSGGLEDPSPHTHSLPWTLEEPPHKLSPLDSRGTPTQTLSPGHLRNPPTHTLSPGHLRSPPHTLFPGR